MKPADDTTFDHLVLRAGRPVLVDFSAEWCAPCKAQKPILQRFADAHPEVDVVLVDVGQAPRAAQTWGVQAMPTLVLFDGDQAVARVQGLQRLPKLEALLGSLPG